MENNNKNILRLLLFTILSVIVVLTVAAVLLFKITNVQIDKNKLIKQFYQYQKDFNGIKKELYDIDKISIEKKETNYIILYNNKEYSLKQKKNEYRFVSKLVNKIDIVYIEKSNSNINIIFNSQIGYSQSIVYIDNMKEFKFGNEIDKIEKIDGNWYYVEED